MPGSDTYAMPMAMGGMVTHGRSVAATIVVGDTRTNIPPRVLNVTPPSGPIARMQPLQLDVAGDAIIRRMWVAVTFHLQPGREVIYDRDGFTPLYRAGSTVTAIGFGAYRFVLRRAGDWPASPTLHVDAVDASGNALVLQ